MPGTAYTQTIVLSPEDRKLIERFLKAFNQLGRLLAAAEFLQASKSQPAHPWVDC